MEHVIISSGYYIASALFVLFAYIFVWISKRSEGLTKKTKDKEKIYACGEDLRPEDLSVPGSSFMRPAVRVLGLKWFKKLHSGDLTEYLLWAYMGLLFLLVVSRVLF